MAKDPPNHVLMNMIGLSQTSREILKDGVVPIFPVVLSTPDSLQFNCDFTGILLTAFCVDVNTNIPQTFCTYRVDFASPRSALSVLVY